jgi:hypothetical protein
MSRVACKIVNYWLPIQLGLNLPDSQIKEIETVTKRMAWERSLIAICVYSKLMVKLAIHGLPFS